MACIAPDGVRKSIALLGIALAGATPTAVCATSVDDLLVPRLREQYPSITRWEITPFARAREAEMPKASEMSVVKLGPRSAVRIGGRLQWYAVAGFRPVATATRAIAAGEKLDAHAAVLEDRNVVGSRCEPIVDAQTLKGQRAAKPLRAGEVICSSSVQPQPLVARGDVVAVRYIGSRVVLLTKAIAQVDGWVGEEILVRNPQSHTAFRALVSGAGEVTVHE
jgi:flagella basal body P-ring formation protein FlgA